MSLAVVLVEFWVEFFGGGSTMSGRSVHARCFSDRCRMCCVLLYSFFGGFGVGENWVQVAVFIKVAEVDGRPRNRRVWSHRLLPALFRCLFRPWWFSRIQLWKPVAAWYSVFWKEHRLLLTLFQLVLGPIGTWKSKVGEQVTVLWYLSSVVTSAIARAVSSCCSCGHQYLSKAGVPTILCNGETAEFTSLTTDERRLLVEFAREAFSGEAWFWWTPFWAPRRLLAV